MRIHDVSLTVGEGLPVWPGDPPVVLHPLARIADGAEANVSKVSCGVHVGTHVDAPRHFVEGGAGVEALDLDTMVGPATLAEFPGVDTIDVEDLERMELRDGVERLLLKTSNSDLWRRGVRDFVKNYVAISPDAAQWVVDRGIRLIGVDYLSVQLFSDPEPTTHRVLLGNGVVVVEGLNFSRVAAGTYQLICLPWKLAGADGAPARVVLVENP